MKLSTGGFTVGISILVWLAFALFGRPAADPTTRLISTMLLLAPLLLVPLAARLLDPNLGGAPEATGWALPAWGVALAMALPEGTIAALLTAPWLVMALWLMWKTTPSRLSRWREPAIVAELFAAPFLVVGCVWLLISRLGLRPLDFDSVIVLLTSVHFHFAGFCTLTIVARLARRVPPGSRTAYQAAALGTVAGTPILAAGITLSPLLELVGAGILAGSLLLLAGLLLFVIVPRLDSWPAQTLLGSAAGFLAIGMVLAAGYGVAEFEGLPILPIPQMAALHGIANGAGFVTLGLLGLWMLE